MNIFKTDWIASRPVFYHEKTGMVSYNINDVIDFENIEFHPEGLNNFLEFGYSVFGQSPVKHVKFLPHSTTVSVDEKNRIKLFQDEDIAEGWAGRETNEGEIIDKIFSAVRNWENSVPGEIIIPTSGGYDSRLLNMAISDKSRIRSFTYGLSDNQSNSFEVVFAKRFSEILGIKWEQVILGEYHKYFDNWEELFGSSTHAHGMYQIEFYKEVEKRVGKGRELLSGIFGDIWAGSTTFQDINSPDDLIKLGYTHGLCADKNMSQLKSDYSLRNAYYEENAYKLKDEFYQILTLIRLKIILISYLITVPCNLGFNIWSPFLIPEIALGMLTLPKNRRRNRLWQKDYFEKYKVNIDDMRLKADRKNTLNFKANLNNKCMPLNSNLLREVINPSYIDWINNGIDPKKIPIERFRQSIFQLYKVGTILRKMGYKYCYSPYCAYLTLKPIENLIRSRDAYYKSKNIF